MPDALSLERPALFFAKLLGMRASLTELERSVRYSFRDISLLERAITHRSWAFENLPNGSDSDIKAVENEVTEFLGDSVLGLAIAEALYRDHPGLGEGDLTLMKHRLVSTATLTKLAEQLNLGSFLRVGRGEEKTGGRKKSALLANTLEAIIGAVFLDSGYIAARKMVVQLFAEELRTISPQGSVDYKSLLQETLQGQHSAAPSYTVINTEGPAHDRVFFVKAEWENGHSTGHGHSIKTAEMMAAAEALRGLDVLPAELGAG